MRGKGLSPCFRPKARSPDSTLPLCFKDNAKIRNPESATHGFSWFLTDSHGFLRFFLLWFSQIGENIRYLGGGEALRPLAVTGLQELLVKRLAKDNPSSEMGTCHFGSGIREILKS